MQLKRYQDKNWEYVGSFQDNLAPLIVFLHGYGANAQDLAPLAQVFDSENQYSWAFIEAPTQLPWPMNGARAWFPIDEQALQEEMLSGKPRDFSGRTVKNLAEICLRLSSLIAHLAQKRPVIVGGFSQGAMISLHLADSLVKKLPGQLSGLILMSGAVVDQEKLNLARLRNCPILITHGKQDPVVAYQQGLLMEKKLSNFLDHVDFFDFIGGHEIPPVALDKIQSFIEDIARDNF